ncbi:Hypothetical predicted protein [Paramuricea clavata]|uniref:Uncharacterized protein n=1 Tax=Paramuricea clavata TaxID=317549 RepID=A0A7D9IR08_PARCT|nr:Hypothetical predicted protein [Paramuricea clavata]
MASRSLKPTRQSMVKCKKQEGQADRETRAFVALQNRKISRKNDIEKKRGIPLMEISIIENEAQNGQEQSKTEKGIFYQFRRIFHVVMVKSSPDQSLRGHVHPDSIYILIFNLKGKISVMLIVESPSPVVHYWCQQYRVGGINIKKLFPESLTQRDFFEGNWLYLDTGPHN